MKNRNKPIKFFFTFALLTLLIKPVYLFDIDSLGSKGDDLSYWIHSATLAFDFDIDYANATNYLDVNGSSNTINFSGSGYGGSSSSDAGYFYLDLDGSSNTVNITQSSTLARDYLKIITNTSNSNICVIQNDSGTTTSC